MKKILFGFMAAAISGMALTSCDMNGENTAKNSFATWNLINPIDGGEPDQCASFYTADMNLSQGIVTLASSLTYNKTGLTFESDEFPLQQNGYSYTFKGFTGNINNLPTMPLEDTRLVVTYNYLYPYSTFTDPDNKSNQFQLNSFFPNTEGNVVGGTPVAGVLYTPSASGGAPIVLGSYRIGHDYLVTAFTCDCTYTGTTRTTYPGSETGATNKLIYYRVVLDVAKDKAYVVIYNAKFSDSEREPAKPVIYLEAMDITWGNGSYSIHATDVVPKIIEDGKLTARPDFTFAEFNMVPSGNWLQNAAITYKVNNTVGESTIQYTGTFTGYFAVVDDKTAN